jgi:hypothetical protein
MARSAPALSTFTAGEISPRLEGRVSIEKYREGLADLTNMIVQPHGGVTRRPGTEYLGEVKDSSVKTRLIPFEFKTADTYILEFGDQTMRVFRNGLQVLEDSEKSVSAITLADPGVLTSASHGLSNGDEVYLYNTSGDMTELVARNYLVANVTTNTFTLQDLFGNDIDTSGYTAYGGSGISVDKIYEIASPYAAADVFDVRFAQSADVMYMVHPSYAIRTLSRTDHNAWTFASASITGSPSPALNTSTDNYPSVVTFFEQRLVFAASNNNPQTLWFSKNADYLNFTVGTAANDALIYTIASQKVNAIRYLSPTRVLTVGTSGGEYVLTTTNGGPVEPTTTVIRKYSNYGCISKEPVQVADLTLFVQRGGRKVREFQYAGEINVGAYAAVDITILSEHLTEGGITDFAYQQEPESVVWALRPDGTLLGLTYRREEEVVAWHKHIIGGTFDSGQAVVESIASLPTDSGEDELYMVVKRTINSVTKRYVEVMKPYDFGSDTTSAFFVDSGLAYSGSATTSLSGLYHLEGEELSILANGATHPDKTVSGGGVSLDFSATSGAVGFGYTSQMQTLRLESGSVDGTSQGKPKRIHDITVRFHETVGAEVGTDANDADRIFFRDSSMSMDEAIPLFSGDKEIEFPGGYDDDARIFVRQTQPLPLTVLALYPRMNTFDL